MSSAEQIKRADDIFHTLKYTLVLCPQCGRTIIVDYTKDDLDNIECFCGTLDDLSWFSDAINKDDDDDV
jgi:hypothetical protein